MKIHEYQAKELFRRAGISVPDGKTCSEQSEIPAIITGMKMPVAVKAQILAGGRGKGGGVLLAKSEEEAVAAAQKILGMQLVTKQTGESGTEVKTILQIGRAHV